MDNNTSQSKEEGFINPNAELLRKLMASKEGAFTFRRRRQPDWNENYLLYRDKVQLNRLTQRQSVNIPLLKSSIKTLLKDIDDPPMLYFVNLDNNDQAEVFYNEYWHANSFENNLTIKDIVDKRQVMLFGRSFKWLNICDGDFYWEIVAPNDVLIDRYVDPSNIDTARFIIREHIYKPLSSLKSNPMFDNEAVTRLQDHMGSEAGLQRSTENAQNWYDQNTVMASLGVIDAYSPVLGETYVELNDHYIKEFNNTTKQDEIIYIVTAEDREVLYSRKLEDHIGYTKDHFWQKHFPCSTWGDETERQDIWSDGVADSLRPLNKVLNAWFSQLVENRTLRSFGMNFYNSSLGDEGFNPQTFDPVPWGWFPIPAGVNGKLGEQIMNVPVPDLQDTIKEMEFVMTVAEKASAATTIQQGVDQGRQITLGEVQLLLKNATDRVKSMSVYYTQSWEDFGLKFTKMLEAAADLIGPKTINKKGRLTNKQYSRTISPEDYINKNGYKVEVKMKEDQLAKDADSLQKLQYTKTLMPMNQALDGIIKQKSLEFADLSASEISEVMREDEMQMKEAAKLAQQSQMGVQGGVQGTAQPQLQAPQMQPQLAG